MTPIEILNNLIISTLLYTEKKKKKKILMSILLKWNWEEVSHPFLND